MNLAAAGPDESAWPRILLSGLPDERIITCGLRKLPFGRGGLASLLETLGAPGQFRSRMCARPPQESIMASGAARGHPPWHAQAPEGTTQVTRTKPSAGLLPFYIELYDRAAPEKRALVEQFLGEIVSALASRGVEAVPAPVCRIREEFEQAVRSFEKSGVDAIVTLHLAYSPSLESAEVLLATRLPLIVLDTTPDFGFGPDQDPEAVFLNHGIHGVQDMCSLLVRHGRPFEIEAGHWQRSDVLDRVAASVRAASAAARMRSARVGRIGEAFAGMGDFAVAPDVLRSTIGIETVVCQPELIRSLLPGAASQEVRREMDLDKERFTLRSVGRQAHVETSRTCLAVRRWIEEERLSAFTVNFLEVTQASGLPAVPFLEASKAMARGIGYAGEGDVLTAALVGALGAAYPATFTEMFCPDWEHNGVFLSHMGEMNLDLAAGKPRLVVKPFPWTDAADPVVALARFRGGKAVLANLAPGPDDSYSFVLAPVTMLDVTGEDRMTDEIHGWFQPPMAVADFLAAYSRAGGTHHSALVYGDVCDELARFGRIMGWRVTELA